MKLLKEFCIKGSPNTRTAQQKGLCIRGGHAQFYEKKEVAQAKAELADALLNEVPDQPYDCKIFLRVLWLFSKKSLTKKEAYSFKTTTPDLDNLIKGCADVMTDMGFWNDDAQIVGMELWKAWNKDIPGLYFQIHEVEESDYTRHVEGWRTIYGE